MMDDKIARAQQHLANVIARTPGGVSREIGHAYSGLAGAYGNARRFHDAVSNNEMAASIFLMCGDGEAAANVISP